MAKIEGFRIKNFRTLKEITLGRLSRLECQQNRVFKILSWIMGQNNE